MARASAEQGGLWPGFDPLAVPLAIFDGERTTLFRHPAPPAGFVQDSSDAPGAFVQAGRFEAITANSSATIGGVPSATLMVGQAPAEALPLNLAAVAIHESFHVFQRERHPGWMGNEADLFTYPTDSVELLAQRRLETDALRRALAADDEAEMACWARQALAMRGQRYARMDSVYSAYERGTELNEGLATYVEMRAAGRQALEIPPEEFGPTQLRRRAYTTGAALALLLDRFQPGWPAAFNANDDQTLDEALAARLGTGSVCEFAAADVAEAERQASADVARLSQERERQLARFEERPGWKLVIEVVGGEPLWPQGFDPLNVERVGGTRILHTRYLCLGNSSGRLEVLNHAALTDGSGPHPLFNGIRVVELTGLPEPELSRAQGTVTLKAEGLTLAFKGASAQRRGEVITVRVGS